MSDLDRAIALYEGTFGMPLVHRETVEEQGVEAVLLDVGDGHVELLSPLGPETVVGRFIAKRGEGLHHVAYRVDDIDATLEALRDAGVELIDDEARIGIRGQPGGVPAPEVHRRGTDRAGGARGETTDEEERWRR